MGQQGLGISEDLLDSGKLGARRGCEQSRNTSDLWDTSRLLVEIKPESS